MYMELEVTIVTLQGVYLIHAIIRPLAPDTLRTRVIVTLQGVCLIHAIIRPLAPDTLKPRVIARLGGGDQDVLPRFHLHV